jgi:hypothetical protein
VNPAEAAELLKHCSAFDNRKPSAAAAVAWASALNDLPFDADARAAVAAFYSTPPRDPETKLWIQPHNVRTLRTKIRNGRLENFQYEPVEGETAREFIARYQGQVRAVASGQVASLGRPALEGGPSRQFLDGIAARGWAVGQEVPDAQADDATVTAIDSVRRSGPLGVICPTCSAAIGRPCKTPAPGGSDKQPLGKPRKHPHSARRRTAEGTPEVTPQQRAAEEERRREASRRALAGLDDGEIVDAEIVDDGEAS